MESKIASGAMLEKAAPPHGYKPIVSNSPFGWKNGPIFEKKSGEKDWIRGFRVFEDHANVLGFCHGGMLMTFADIIMSRAVIANRQIPFVTVRLTTDFVGPVRVGNWVTGYARTVGQTGNTVSLVGELKVDDDPVVVINGVFKYLGKNR